VKKIILVFAAAAIIIAGLWLVAVPKSLLAGLITDQLAKRGLETEVTGLEKGLFYNFSAGKVEIARGGRPLVSLENVEGRINPLPLVILRLSLRLKGTIAGGDFRCLADLAKKGNSISVDFGHAAIEKVPFLSSIGLRGTGLLSGRITVRDGTGDVTFSADTLRLRSTTMGGVALPLDMFSKAQGAMALKGKVLRISSFTFDGAGIYARLRGTVTGNFLDGSMEIMPDSSFASGDLLFSMIRKYEASPGHYVIPVRSHLWF
jgi:type II secretion system protein N